MKITENSSDNFQIDRLHLNGINLINEYSALAIYENIFVNGITVTIDIIEIENFLETQEIEEGAELEITYFAKYPPKIPEMAEYTDVFHLYKIERVKSSNQGNKVYRMHFINQEAHINAKKSISRSYRDKISSEIIESNFSFLESNKELDITASDDFIPLFVVPNLKPLQVINRLCLEAFKAESNDYVFYEDKEKFNCKTITELFEEGPVLEYIMEQTSLDWERDKEVQHRNIIEYWTDKVKWNSLENINTGLYGSKLFTRNILSKIHDFTEFEGKESDFSTPDTLHISSSDNYFNREKIREYQQDRLSRVNNLNENRLIIVTPLNSNITVGKTVDVKIPTTKLGSITEGKVSKELDELLSGKYLISKCKTEITPIEGKNILELIKR